jgi:hypothetical protein
MTDEEVPSPQRVRGEDHLWRYSRFLEHAPRLFIEHGSKEKLTIMRYLKPGFTEVNVEDNGDVLLRQLPVGRKVLAYLDCVSQADTVAPQKKEQLGEEDTF